MASGRIVESVKGLDVSLVDELCGPGYGLNAKEEILLESKKDMRRRGVPSPNIADALACTFAAPVWEPREASLVAEQPVVVEDYNPFSRERMMAQ